MNGQVPLPYILLGRLFASAFVIEMKKAAATRVFSGTPLKGGNGSPIGLPTVGVRQRLRRGQKCTILYDTTFAVCSLLMHIT